MNTTESEKTSNRLVCPETASSIRAIAKRQKVTSLLHFTRVENVESILRHGLLPRQTLDEYGIRYIANDHRRLDGNLDGVCTSIGFPNYRMFYSLRQSNRGAKWVVLELEPSVLWTVDCSFYHGNSASAEFLSISASQLKGGQAFNSLFQPEEQRVMMGLSSYMTTDPQAEAVVFGCIDPAHIKAVHEEGSPKGAHFFCPRVDYEFWSSARQTN